jgi:hypothetical protein
LPADIPAPIRILIQRCLAKDARLRVADISTALYVIGDTADHAVAAPSVTPQPVNVPLWRRLALLAAAAIIAGAAVGATLWPTARPDAPRVTRFSLSPTGAETLQIDAQSRDLAITPDGTSIVYKGGSGRTNTRLFARMLGALEPTPLTIPGNARAPFASADGQWIGFVEPAPVTLNKVAITGGPALRICALDGSSRGASWGDDDSIVFATNSTATGLQRVSSAGGEPAVITRPNRERGESDHLYPQFLPGSQAVLFTITTMIGGIEAAQLAVLDLRAGTQKILMRGGSQSHYLPSGHLVYVAGGALRAVRFDLERLEVIGTSISVVPQIATLTTGTAEFDIARDGTLVYIAGAAGDVSNRTLVWVDRQGREEPLKSAPARAYLTPRLSPDGTRVAIEIREQGNDIWVWNLVRETLTKVTSDPGLDQAPVWTIDGRRLVFSSQAGGAGGALFWQLADGAGSAERLTHSSNTQIPSAVLADGSRVLFWEASTESATDLKTVALDGDRAVQPLLQTPQAEFGPTVSPDGRWLAYQSTDSGQTQIFVRPFPKVDEEKIQVSTAGGFGPVWAKSGEQLFFQALDGALMSVDVRRGGSWTAGTPARLIDARYYGGTRLAGTANYYVSPDGKRFLMLKESGADSNSPPTIVVVQNWTEELKRLVPSAR